MKQRIITAAIALAIFIPCLIWSQTFVFDVLFSFLTVIGVFELIRCTGNVRNYVLLVPSLLLAAFLPLTVRLIDVGVDYLLLLIISTVLYSLFVLTVSVFSKGKLPVTDAGLIITFVIYIITGFSGVVFVRSIDVIGVYIYLIIFVSSWIPDTGAYFVGVLFGKHKLIPDVSPKKTVEGAIGGIVTCIIAFVIYSIIVRNAFDVKINIWLMILAAVFLAVASMIGDLMASLVKRHYEIKDFGKILPGHGGILDRFDSVLATSSLLFALCIIPGFITGLTR